jgi:hypothetical protein
MTDQKTGENAVVSDTDQHEVVSEGMQGGTGEMDANGLEKNFDREEKLSELQENLQDVVNGGEGHPDAP